VPLEAARAAEAGVGEDDVDAPEGVERPAHERVLVAPLGHVAADRDGALVAADSYDNETLYVTHDAGGSWARIVPPRRRPRPGFTLAPGIIVAVGDGGISVTTDEGATWRPLQRRARDVWCAASRPSAVDIWITCDSFSRTILFRSGDGGRTWTRRVSHRLLDGQLSGTGGPEAWATSISSYSTSKLWHTIDGGATWTQAWVSLRPRARARQIDCAIVPSGVLHDPLGRCR
jgi:photosystem II stability/assembly factor-like uncharacterized protein